jgi:ribosomal protein L32
MIRALTSAATNVLRRTSDTFLSILHPPNPQLVLAPAVCGPSISAGVFNQQSPTIADCLWFAVPKSKISRGKKRMKTTLQKAVKKKEHIVVDRRTGEVTLRHRLPFNWKDYLPGN